jgi:hypothetical protein
VTRAGTRAAIAVAVVAFLAVSLVLARWLEADSVERTKVERLLTAQGRGDAAAMARQLDGCDAACRSRLPALAARLGRPGALRIVRYDSHTAHALGAKTAPTRVVWTLPGTLTTVQCITVRRTGSVVTGPRVRLTALSAPIGREAAC